MTAPRFRVRVTELGSFVDSVWFTLTVRSVVLGFPIHKIGWGVPSCPPDRYLSVVPCRGPESWVGHLCVVIPDAS